MLHWMPGWRLLSYRVSLILLRPTSVELALEAVRQRVREGGHDIPEQCYVGAS